MGPLSGTGENFFRDLCENALDMIQCVSPEGRFLYVNDTWLATLGYDREDLASLTMLDVIHPDCREHCGASFGTVLEGEPLEGFETVFVSKSGEEVPVEGNATCLFEKGRPVHTRGMFRDIRIRLAARAELDGLFRLSPDLLCIAGTDGFFKRVNPAFQKLLGYPLEELTGRSFLELVHPDDRDRTGRELSRQRGGEPVDEFENRYLAKDGSWHWLSWRAAPPRDGLIYAVARDITAQKRLESKAAQQARELERSNLDLEQLAWTASHDLRAPLRSIGNLAEWIEEDLSESAIDKIAAHTAKLRSQVARMESLIDDLLDYARVGRTRSGVESVDVAKMVEELGDLLSPGESFQIAAHRTLPTIVTHRTPLAQVLRNLIDNAVGHHDRDEGRIEVAAIERGDRFEITVEDDGPGIPAKQRETIFGMFQKMQAHEKTPGTGIGLALVKRIVESYGGEVWISDPPERGVRFHFTWPMSLETGTDDAENPDRR